MSNKHFFESTACTNTVESAMCEYIYFNCIGSVLGHVLACSSIEFTLYWTFEYMLCKTRCL